MQDTSVKSLSCLLVNATFEKIGYEVGKILIHSEQQYANCV